MTAALLPTLGKVAVVALLVLVNAFFVAAEFALVGIRRSRVDELATAGSSGAQRLQRALDTIDIHLAATQLGVTLASLALGWLGEPTFAQVFGPLLAGVPGGGALAHLLAGGIAFALITTLQIVLGELAPKNLALQRTERTALFVIGPLTVFAGLFRPAIIFLNLLGTGVLKGFGLRGDTAEQMLHSPDELKRLVAESTEGGLIDGAQQEVVERAFDMTTLPVRAIMTPRREIAWIDADKGEAERLAALRDTRHALLLVARGGLDSLLGVVRKHDLLDAHLAGQSIDPLEHVREPVVLPSTATVLHALELFKERPVAMAVVVDEYGIVLGLVTQANLLEAMAGDIPEEDEPDLFHAEEDGSYRIDGGTPMAEAITRIGLPHLALPHEYQTIAGFCLDRFQGLPAQGAAFEEEGWRFEAAQVNRLRIKVVSVRRS